jgi:hypothetical protein
MTNTATKVLLAVVTAWLLATTHAAAATSITYTVGPWRITLTDLGVLPGGTASKALAINDAGLIVGLATDSTFALQRPLWDASTGAIVGCSQTTSTRPARRSRRTSTPAGR